MSISETKLVNPGKNMCRSSKTKLISIIYTEIRIQLDQNIQECLGFRHGARLPITNSYPASKIASNLSNLSHWKKHLQIKKIKIKMNLKM